MTTKAIDHDSDQIAVNERRGQWSEKYRPQSVNDLILPQRLDGKIRAFTTSEATPNLLFIGPAGIGKTSGAKIISKAVAPQTSLYASAAAINQEEQLSMIGRFAVAGSLFGGQKIAVVEDVDMLSTKSQRVLCNVIDQAVGNCGVILTTGDPKKLITPLRSRCVDVDLTPISDEKEELQQKCLKRMGQIVKKENSDLEAEAIENIITQHFPDFRRILNEVQGRLGA